MIVHVTTQGARILREGRHLLVRKENDIYHTLFVHRLEQLVLYGNIGITPQALAMLLHQGVDTVFLRRDGRYKGRLATPEPKNVLLRKRQFALADVPEFRIGPARAMVQGKLLNMATLLLRIRRMRGIADLDAPAHAIRSAARDAETVESLASLRGIEGAASSRYFASLRHGFVQDHGFRRRVRRPPTDPVNAVLSLLYTFCINRMYAAVRQAGLDPYVGALHDLEYGRFSLPLDLVEEFRPIVADALTLSLFNQKVLARTDFHTVEPEPEPALEQGARSAVDAAWSDPLHAIQVPRDEDFFDMPEQPLPSSEGDAPEGKRALRLSSGALKRVITAFEKKMDAEFYHPLAERKLTYAQAMVFQARLYRRVVEGEAIGYQPLLLR
ncbi:MAG: CRISPR-associated endonuclease Cas1 [Desulfovibrio sp.]|nr:CRISPR-associated endonuclease Cas1 [Desulfovibrio sp.]